MSRCAHCLARLPDPPPETCPRCQRPTRDGSGRLLLPLDLAYDGLVARQEAAARTLLVTGTAVATLVSLALPLLHAAITPPAVASLMVLAHLIAMRVLLLREPRPYLGAGRRFFHRWIPRLLTLTLGLWGYGLTLVPVLGGVMGGLTFASLTLLTHRYGLFTLEQERARAPLTWWEKAIVVTLAVAGLATLALLVFAAFLLTWVAGKLNLFSG